MSPSLRKKISQTRLLQVYEVQQLQEHEEIKEDVMEHADEEQI